jgi:O-methyltransferase
MRHGFKKEILGSVLRNAFHWLRLPDARYYTVSASRPLFRPYKTDAFKRLYAEVRRFTLVSPDRAQVLYSCALQAGAVEGDFIECGVYQGGTAMLLQRALESPRAVFGKRLLLFDTFEGMPENGASGDSYLAGELGDTSYQDVLDRLGTSGNTDVFKGFIPDTFARIADRRFAFAHVDVDIYQSIRDCCEFIYPRLNPGGWMVFDDYGFPSCAGGRRAIDEFFAERPEVPIVLPTGQALLVKLPPSR